MTPLPSEAQATQRVGYVYWLSDGQRVKIGFSAVPKNRTHYLQKITGSHLTLVALEPAAISREGELHRLFAPKRLMGEWFRFDNEMRIAAKAIGIVDGKPLQDLTLLRQRDAALHVGLSRASFRRAVAAGLISPAAIHPFGGARYDTADLDAYLEACRWRAQQARGGKRIKRGLSRAETLWIGEQIRRAR